jgi:hypothetical protein
MPNSPVDDIAGGFACFVTIRDKRGAGVPIAIDKAYHWSDWLRFRCVAGNAGFVAN